MTKSRSASHDPMLRAERAGEMMVGFKHRLATFVLDNVTMNDPESLSNAYALIYATEEISSYLPHPDNIDGQLSDWTRLRSLLKQVTGGIDTDDESGES